MVAQRKKELEETEKSNLSYLRLKTKPSANKKRPGQEAIKKIIKSKTKNTNSTKPKPPPAKKAKLKESGLELL
jgi:hypothetical protein